MQDPQKNPDWPGWPVSERVVQLAAYHCDVLRVQEEPKGSNRGPVVDLYLETCGIEAAPWCLAMQMWLLLQCGVPETHLPRKGIRGSTQRVARWARAMGVVVDAPQRGDIFIHLNGDHATGHAGVYLGPGEGAVKNAFRSIEGNTNEDGDREGYEVCRKLRPLSYASLWVRIR